MPEAERAPRETEQGALEAELAPPDVHTLTVDRDMHTLRIDDS